MCSNRRGSRQIGHIGSAHNKQESAALKAVAVERLAAGQLHLDLGIAAADGGGSLPITSARMAVLADALAEVYVELGLGDAPNGNSVFRDLVLARIIEPTSKLDSLRVLDEVGVSAASYATIKRRFPIYAKSEWRKVLAAQPARLTLASGRPHCASTTSPPSILRPTRLTGSVSPASRKSAAWNHRSPSACSPMRVDFR